MQVLPGMVNIEESRDDFCKMAHNALTEEFRRLAMALQADMQQELCLLRFELVRHLLGQCELVNGDISNRMRTSCESEMTLRSAASSAFSSCEVQTWSDCCREAWSHPPCENEIPTLLSSRPLAFGRCDKYDGAEKKTVVRKTTPYLLRITEAGGSSSRRDSLDSLVSINIWKKYSSGHVTAWQAMLLWTQSEYFDYVVGALLLANAVLIGVEVDQGSRQSSESSTFFRVMAALFCLVFVAEFAMRVVVEKIEFFRGKGWRWNVFDTIIVISQVLDEILKLWVSDSRTLSVRMLSVIRILRLMRMVRLFPELRQLVLLISASLNAFLWTGALLLILIYCMAVYCTEVAMSTLRNPEMHEPLANSTSLGRRDDIERSFGSIATSSMSLFQAISGGDDWRNFVDQLQSGSSSFVNTVSTFLFAIYIAFATLVMLNLVTGVFVEGAQRLIREERNGELKHIVMKLFKLPGTNGSRIYWEQIQAQRMSKRMIQFLNRVDLSFDDAEHLFRVLDPDGYGFIEVQQFVDGCIRLKSPPRMVDLNDLRCRIDDISEATQTQLTTISMNVKSLLDGGVSVSQ